MSTGRHARVREPRFLMEMSGLSAVLAGVIAALASDPRMLRFAIVLALAAVIPPSLVAAGAPRMTDVRGMRREVAALRAELTVRQAPIVEVIVIPAPASTLGSPTSVNGSAYLDRTDGRRLVLDLVALEAATASAG